MVGRVGRHGDHAVVGAKRRHPANLIGIAVGIIAQRQLRGRGGRRRHDQIVIAGTFRLYMAEGYAAACAGDVERLHGRRDQRELLERSGYRSAGKVPSSARLGRRDTVDLALRSGVNGSSEHHRQQGQRSARKLEEIGWRSRDSGSRGGGGAHEYESVRCLQRNINIVIQVALVVGLWSDRETVMDWGGVRYCPLAGAGWRRTAR